MPSQTPADDTASKDEGMGDDGDEKTDEKTDL